MAKKSNIVRTTDGLVEKSTGRKIESPLDIESFDFKFWIVSALSLYVCLNFSAYLFGGKYLNITFYGVIFLSLLIFVLYLFGIPSRVMSKMLKNNQHK